METDLVHKNPVLPPRLGRNKLYEPTPSDINTVRSMAACGMTEEQISRCIGADGISVMTLRKHFQRELETAGLQANAVVANRMFQMASEGKPPAATMFWLKCRAGWRETQVIEGTGKDGAINIVVSAEQKNW